MSIGKQNISLRMSIELDLGLLSKIYEDNIALHKKYAGQGKTDEINDYLNMSLELLEGEKHIIDNIIKKFQQFTKPKGIQGKKCLSIIVDELGSMIDTGKRD